MEGIGDDDVVISGMSGVNPASDNIQEFIENLYKGLDLTTTDHKKWTSTDCPGVSKKVGVVSKLGKCDVQFFGINRKVGHSFDPVTRRFLEHSLEAIIDAGISPGELKGSKTGVIFTAAVLETEMNLAQGVDQESYAIMGKTRTLTANRVSYWLDLKGPSYSLDCGWNGGLQAILDAVHSIKTGLTDAVILGSGNSIFSYHPSYQYNKLNLLSPDGFTRSFDAEGTGYGRSEAVNVILLQKGKNARRCYGTVVHVMNACMAATNNLIYEPVLENWQSMLETFYSECKVNPKDVSYLEAYGSANHHHDSLELNAAGELLCAGRTADNPLYIGCVKSNMGHAEAASSLVGVIKLAITANTGTIPPNLHCENPNPFVRNLVKGNMKVVTKTVPLDGDYVAINSFALGSQYGHLLLKRNPKKKTKCDYKDGELPQLITLAARTDEGMASVFDAIEKEPYDPEYYNLINKAFDQGVNGYMYRGFMVLPTVGQKVREYQYYQGEKRPLWFVFTGMGCQWATMGRDLMAIPVFRNSIEISHNLLKPKGLDLKYIITHDDPALFENNILHCFVGIVSIQIALIDLLKSVDVTPDGIIGHSVGEAAASYCDGCSTHAQTLLIAYYRGKISLEGNLISGRMAAVGLGYQAMKDRLPEGIEVACHNASESCTLTGPTEQVEKYVTELQAQGIFARTVNAGNIPYHSKHVQHLGPKMVASLHHLFPAPKRRSSKWISTSVPEERWGEESAQVACGKYHANNLVSPVLFEEGSRHIPNNAVVLEIAPHGLLQAILRRSHPKCTNIAVTNRNSKNQQNSFLQALGRLYLSGVNVNLAALYPPVSYPVSRNTPPMSHLVTWDHSEDWRMVNDFSGRLSSHRHYDLKTEFSTDVLCAQKLDGVTIVPYSTYLILAWKTFAEAQELKMTSTRVEFKDVLFNKDIVVTDARDLKVSVYVLVGGGNFDIVKDDCVIVSGVIRLMDKQTNLQLNNGYDSESKQEVDVDEFYDGLLHVGHGFDVDLQCFSKVSLGKKGLSAQIDHQYDWNKYLAALFQLHIMVASGESSHKVQKLRKIFHLRIDPEITRELEEIELDLETGNLTSANIEMHDVKFTRVERNPIKFAKEELNTPVANIPPTANPSTKIAFVQYHGKSIEKKQLAYSGTSQTQGKVMGLALAEEETLAVKEDPILAWKIPVKWTLEQAVSVPLNFILAYNAIHIFGDLKKGYNAVVTEGLNKLGLACLRVALDITSDVYTFVANEEEKVYLQTLLPKLPRAHIIVNKGKGSEQLCLLTKQSFPEGVDLFINTGAPENVKTAVPCVSSYGKIIEMSDEMFQERGKLENTSAFLKSASFYACGGTTVIKSHDANKRALQSLFEDGIANGVVIPLNDPAPRDWRDTQTIRMDANIKSNAIERYICEPDKAYLILGGDAASWVSIAEWFISRKAKHVIVVHQEKNINRTQQNKIKNLQAKANLIVKTAEKLSPELIKHIFEVSRAKIKLTMLLPMKHATETDEAVLASLCKQDTFLVTVLRPTSPAIASNELSNRSSPTLTVLWNEPLNGKTGSFLQSFDRLLTMEKNTVIQVSSEAVTTKEDNELGEILPKTIEEVLRYNEHLPLEVTLTELRTNGLPFDKVREIVPLFIIPGINSRSTLVQRFQKVMYPVFVVDCPSFEASGLQACAAQIALKMRVISQGPFAILGEGWGGPVSMATARALEVMGEKTQVFLLSATPEDIAQYNWGSSVEADEAVLSRLFGSDPKREIFDSWGERLNYCTANLPSEQRIATENVLSAIREKIELLRTPDMKLGIEGPVHCITRSRTHRQMLNWMSKQELSVRFIKQNKQLLDEETLRYIQDNVIVKKILKCMH